MTAATEHSFRIDEQPFDSGRLARRVGVVTLTGAEPPEPGLGARIRRRGQEEGFDLLTLKSGGPVDLESFEPRGVLLELTGGVGQMRRRMARFLDRVPVRPIEGGDWPALGSMLAYAAPTRFSRDPRLTPRVVAEHKLAMLRAYAQRYPQHALVVETDEPGERIGGFQVSFVDKGRFVYYEIVVAPALRRGFAAVALLGENVTRYDGPDNAEALTRIYEDNETSLRLFERLGMVRTGRRDYYYHCWTR